VGSTSEIVLGIDLGTSYSTASALIDGKLHFALDGRGEACVPSVVHFPKTGKPIVGADAEKLRASDPHNTIFGIKRLIGRSADSPPARLLDACSTFKIKQPHPGGEAAIQVRPGLLQASEIAALILRHLRERAEERFGRKIAKAVLTLPVTAPEAVQSAMVRCGRMAGLEVLSLVHEPVAGAISHFDAAAEGPLLVYDFGGGTFDATVVEQRDGQLHVRASGGDDCLGGDDFDGAFARVIADATWKSRSVDVTKDAILWDRVQRQCEQVKRALSRSPQARFRVPEAFGSGPRAVDLEANVTRASLVPKWADLVERSIQCSADTLRDADVTSDQLGAVLLIGGTTYVPQVREGVALLFPRPCIAEEDPQTAVARGAALIAANPALLAA